VTGYRADPGDGAGTDWSAYDVPAIWSMVADFDPGPQWRHVTGWQRACSLTERHLTEMRSFRDRLAAAWPLSPGSASSAYVAELDRLIASVQATYDAATANHGVMSAATHAIAEVRDQLEPVYEQWQAHESAMAAYEAAVESSRSGPLPTPMPGPPPVPVSWRDELNARARGVMEAVSGELALASLQLTQPPEYSAPRLRADPGQDRLAADGGPGFVSPVVPSVVPKARVGTRRGGIAGTRSAKEARDRPATKLSTRQRHPTAGRTTTSAPGVVGGRPRGSTVGTAGRDAFKAEHAKLPLPTHESATSHSRSAPRQPFPGVIGVQPGPGNPAANVRQTPRVNPVGGVISSAPLPRPAHGSGNDRRANLGSDGTFGSLRNSGRSLEQEQARDDRDPDNPWSTIPGVTPVIEARPCSGRHDPGPAIGLAR